MKCLRHKLKLSMAISDLSACENIAGTWCSNWVSNCDNPGYRVRYGSGDWDTVAHYCQESCGLCGTNSPDSNNETEGGNEDNGNSGITSSSLSLILVLDS